MMPALSVQVAAVIQKAETIRQFELLPSDGQMLPAFTAGAHIDVHLPIGLTRSYSLVNPQEERSRYVIAVSHASGSRGGSRYLYEEVKRGDVLKIGHPRNNFQLDEGAEHSVLIAGGIGATPIVCMISAAGGFEAILVLALFCAQSRSRCFCRFPVVVRRQSDRMF